MYVGDGWMWLLLLRNLLNTPVLQIWNTFPFFVREIMELCNTLTYEQNLKCASDEVAMATLDVPCWEEAQTKIKSRWLADAIDPSCPVCFLDTDKVAAELYCKTL